MIWIGLAIGTLFGGGLLILYNWLIGGPHDRRIALFQLKVEEIKRAFNFAQNMVKIADDIMDLETKQPRVSAGEIRVYDNTLSNILEELKEAVREGDLLYLTLSEQTEENYSVLYKTAKEYCDYLANRVKHQETTEVPALMSPKSVLVLNSLVKEVKLYLKGKGFPKVEYEWWWKKTPLS